MSTLRIRRVVVGIADAGTPVQAAIAAAAELAHMLDAELTGLFIEDALLFDAAAFLAGPALEPRSLPWQALDAARLAEAHELAARAVERRLRGEAAARGVPAGFQVARGDPATTLTRQVEPSDLIVIAEPADAIARSLPPYPDIVRAAWELPAAVLYVPQRARRKAGAVAVQADSADDPALKLGAAVAAALGERLVVLAAGPAGSESAIARAARDLAGRECAMLALGAMRGDTMLAATRLALAPYRERLLVTSRHAVAGDMAGYLALARERAVPLLVAPAG